MHIAEIFRRTPTTFSFEFSPPKTDQAAEELYRQAAELAALRPSYVSVTYGAGGSTRARTHESVIRMRQDLHLDVMPHLTCVGSSRDELRSIVEEYRANGIENLMALRGDPPLHRADFVPHPEGLRHACELVELIAAYGGMGIGVAGYPEGHPETASKLHDLEFLKQKVDAGAHVIATQLFFDNRDFFDFRERCELIGIHVPIVAGIMPILSRKGIERMCHLCGSRLPAPLLRQLIACGNDDGEVQKVGIEWATRQCDDLLRQGVRGIHFYTLNRSRATQEIYVNLGLSGKRA